MLNGQTSFKELIIKAQNGNPEAAEQLVDRLSPLIKKYSSQLGYDDARSELTLWTLETINHRKPNVIWESNVFNS